MVKIGANFGKEGAYG